MVVDVSATTLVIVNAPTLRDGLVELVRIGDAMIATDNECGVWIERTADGRMIHALPDYDVPVGVLETTVGNPVQPWRSPLPPVQDNPADQTLLLAAVSELTGRDVVATADGIYLQ